VSDLFAKLQAAAAFAARAHQGHLRKDGRTPYISHSFRVCLVVRHVFGFDDPEMLMAALLHDTIEDTTTDFDDINEQFGPRVAEWVQALTKDKRLPEQVREDAYARALINGGWQVHALKLADIYDNLSDLENLPSQRRPQTLARSRFYMDRVKSAITDDLQRAYDLTERRLADAGQT
jgi:guanosine-3',5'-bis(diphosphate) 3'-pyrophosphohydrolase